MASTSVEVVGLVAVLESINVHVGRQLVLADAAVQAAADICLKEAQRLCPVGTPESTHKKDYVGGTLKKSLNIQRGVMSSAVVTDVPYAPFVEFGTYKMAAQPYLGPANDIAQQALLEMLKNNLI